MRILIDTNIFISLEDSSAVLEDSFSELSRLSLEFNHTLLTNPSSINDLERDKDTARKTINLSRIRKYPLLDNPPPVDAVEISKLGLKNDKDNDRVDNDILYAIYKDAANILVTEDRGIHRKAKKLGIEDRVHYIQQAAQSLKRLHETIHVKLPNIKEVALHEIDLSSSFFDTLRAEYPGFDQWYKRSSRNGRRAWSYRSKPGRVDAILIYKEEDNEIVTDDNRALPGKALKLCTFKVSEDVRGRKIGELFLKAAFRYATANAITNIYITMRSGKHDFLQDLCMNFGFYYYGAYKGDNVFVKEHPIEPPMFKGGSITPLEYHKQYYPHFIYDKAVNKYIVPIKPVYHRVLFPDNQEQLGLFTHSSVGNAIKQAYLCHARMGGIRPGDVLLFYRSGDRKAITSVGIAENIQDIKDLEEIMQMVSKRTVYSFEEIAVMAQKKTKVILFRLAMHLDKEVGYQWLKDNRVVRGPIQTIRKITDESFQKIYE